MRSIPFFFSLVLLLALPPPLEAQEVLGSTTQSRAAGSDPGDPTSQIPGGPVSRWSIGGFVGFQAGLSFQAFGVASNFAQGFPLRARFRAAWTSVEPGSAPDARKIFINDATNGTPKEAGNTWDLGIDGLYPVGDRTHFFGGVRYSSFTANFKYVGGNEDFDVTSGHWGLAAGLEAGFPMGPKMSLILSGGAEYFFSSRLTGHDTSYSPDGDDVNPRKDYTYTDADDAVDQPVWRPLALVGFSYRLGG